MRGAVIPCVTRKTSRLDSTQVNLSAALTLISTDIETITQRIVQMHELWAALLEIAIGSWLLYRQLSGAVGVPIGFVMGKFDPYVSSFFFKKKEKTDESFRSGDLGNFCPGRAYRPPAGRLDPGVPGTCGCHIPYPGKRKVISSVWLE